MFILFYNLIRLQNLLPLRVSILGKNMKLSIGIILYFTNVLASINMSKMVCYYDNQAYWRKGVGKMKYDHLKPALEHCDYLIYTYIGINSNTYQAESLDSKLDLSSGKNNFKAITSFKHTYPHLKVLLSIGGYADLTSPDKYLKVIGNEVNRINFICSLMSILKEYDFDGVDLAWQFPAVKDKRSTDMIDVLWKTVQKFRTFFITDDKPGKNRNYFTQLCKELRAAVNGENKTLTLSVIANSNYKAYYDLDALHELVEQIHVMNYDYNIPELVPRIADFYSPLYQIPDRDSERNIEATINYFLNSTLPANKIIMAIPAFGRTWKMTPFSGKSVIPPVSVDGPGEAGRYTQREGVLSYYEICADLTTLTDVSSITSETLTMQQEVNLSYGTYAYRLPKHMFSTGIWVSYETPETAALKGSFARERGLGGIAIVDLTFDDFKGFCITRKDTYPILRSARNNFLALKNN